MDPLSIDRIAEFAGAERQHGHGETSITHLSTDSRTTQPGDLFVALRGENFDGHKFVNDAFVRGAAGAIVERKWSGKTPSDFALLRVADTLAAYQQVAARYRRSLGLKVVAITGSNGKTSTKDFTASVLARRFRVTKTEGNFNNHVGLPRTMLEAGAEDEIAVWEIGMNHPGEIAPLAELAKPDVAIITNIGLAHIEFMGSREAIAQEKGDLAASLGPNGILILNSADEFAPTIAQRTSGPVILAGIEEGEVRARNIAQTASGAEFSILEGAHHCHAVLPVPGLHMVQNALLAVAAGRAFGLSLEDCAAGLASAPLTKARLQIKTIHGVQFIDDSYNANPDSTKAALRTLAELETDGQRIAILGQMAELGAEARRGHAEVGECAASLGINRLIALGPGAAGMATSAAAAGLAKSSVVGSAAEAADLLRENAHPGDLVLVKGSRSARTELVLEEFAKRQLETPCAS
ncbi:MAG TPA: UDP-N-acetylmuramoyl-tripeptide--D-alanyl-D-alanine ligase [Chthoniobacterales bacterium]|nr:UDP-N-acetylmuramoyl-tripeptide--D-alanyl-D-alanine ligase [Chthoniobacterales bacterium]